MLEGATVQGRGGEGVLQSSSPLQPLSGVGPNCKEKLRIKPGPCLRPLFLLLRQSPPLCPGAVVDLATSAQEP